MAESKDLSNEEISRLLSSFINSKFNQEEKDGRKKALEKLSEWLKPEVINELPDEELREKFRSIFSMEYVPTFNPIYRDRIVSDLKRLREVLRYLLDETIDYRERFREVVKGEKHIEGVGRGLASLLLLGFNAEKYCIWNQSTEFGLGALGIRPYDSSDDMGIKYEKVLGIIRELKGLATQPLNFLDMHAFLYFISQDEEGIQLLKEVKKSSGEEVGITSSEERIVQEIFEANFESTLGEKLGLELYNEDPDSNGAQYRISIGIIDFLTIDKQTKDFVVVELKRGKAQSEALGQILGYMGWVKQNLAESRNVRGIILAEDADERLLYALKNVPNVEFRKYKLSVKIQ